MASSMEYARLENLNEDRADAGLLQHDAEHGRTGLGLDTSNHQQELFQQWGLGNTGSSDTTLSSTV